MRPLIRSMRLWYLLPLLLALLVGCSRGAAPGTGTPAGEKSAPTNAGAGTSETGKADSKAKSGETAQSLKQVYTDPKSGLTLKVPSEWQATLREDAVVAFLSPQNGEEDLFRENVLITADPGFKDLSLEAYRKAMSQEVRKRYPDTKTLESGEVKIAGLPAYWEVDTFTGSKGLSKVYRVVVVKEGVAYVFHATALAPTFDRYRPTFEAIAGSISWTKTQP